MKKLFFIIPIILLLISCGNKPAELNRSFKAEVMSRYNGVEIKAELIADESRYISLALKSPPSVKGCVYTYKNGKMILSRDDASITCDDNCLPLAAFPQIMYNVLRSLGREGNYNSNNEYNGKCDSGSFTLNVDSGGTIHSIEIKRIGFKAELVYK